MESRIIMHREQATTARGISGEDAQKHNLIRHAVQRYGIIAQLRITAACAIIATTSLQTAGAQPRYTIQHIAGLQDNFVVRISDAGHVVAGHYLWYRGGLTNLGGLGGTFTAVEDVNASGQVVGRSTDAAGIMHAFLWQNGTMALLPTLGGEEGYATAINNAGEAVGYTDNITGGYVYNYHATFWTSSHQAVDLGTVPPDHSSLAHAINNSGQVAGTSLFSMASAFGADAFFWDGNSLTAFIQNQDPFEFEIGGMNDLGQVVGYYNSTAFVWQNGVMNNLGTLGGTFSMADSINNAGEIVGRSTANSGGSVRAVLFADGQVYDLNQLVVDSSDWECLSVAYDINNFGQIVGIGRRRGGFEDREVFLLTPIHEPPVIADASANPVLLWPPNNKMVTVNLTAVLQAQAEQATWRVIDVECNEHIGAGDIQIKDDHTVLLRAARSGSGDGRAYTLWLRAFDVFGNPSEPKAVTVTVAHDQRKLPPVGPRKG